MSRPVYVLAILGTSPAILTELCWALVAREDARVVGLEIWTTGGGARSLERALGAGCWDALRTALGERAHLVPDAPAVDRLRQAVVPARPQLAGLSAASAGAFAVSLLTGDDGRVLDDVRDSEDCDRLLAGLHDRVRALRLGLPADVELVASLAGGRKTQGAALQTAVSLQARPGDRLVHVLVHPELEKVVVKPDAGWWAPVGPWTLPDGTVIPVDEQVEVYDVPVPPLRAMVEHLQRPLDDLDRLPWAEVTSAIRGALGAAPLDAVRLAYDGSRFQHRAPWTLSLSSGDREVVRGELSATTGGLLAVYCRHGAPLLDLELEALLSTADFPVPSGASDGEGGVPAVRKARGRLARELRACLDAASPADRVQASRLLDELRPAFLPRAGHYVPAASKVEVIVPSRT